MLDESKMKNSIKEIFSESLDDFLEKELDLLESCVSERSICGRIAQLLNLKTIDKTEFENYHVDIEYNRNQGEIKTIIDNNHEIISITCDLIIHSRGKVIKQDNLLAIEFKKSNRPDSEKLKDRNRLKALTKKTFDDTWSNDGTTLPRHVCGYLLGIYVEFNLENKTIFIEEYEEGQITIKNQLNY